MTDKSLIELVEEYGCYQKYAGYYDGVGRPGPSEESIDQADALLSEIRQRLEADAERLAGLERGAARYRWLLGQIRYGDAGSTTYACMKYDFGPASMTPSTLDEAIDLHMEAKS
jgi:hypothetical protein